MKLGEKEFQIYLTHGFRLHFASPYTWERDSYNWIDLVPGEVLDIWIESFKSKYGHEAEVTIYWMSTIDHYSDIKDRLTDPLLEVYQENVCSLTMNRLFSHGPEAGRVRKIMEELIELMYRYYFPES